MLFAVVIRASLYKGAALPHSVSSQDNILILFSMTGGICFMIAGGWLESVSIYRASYLAF